MFHGTSQTTVAQRLTEYEVSYIELSGQITPTTSEFTGENTLAGTITSLDRRRRNMRYKLELITASVGEVIAML